MNLRVAHVLYRYAGTVPPEWIAAEIDRLKSALDAPLPPKWDIPFALGKIQEVQGIVESWGTVFRGFTTNPYVEYTSRKYSEDAQEAIKNQLRYWKTFAKELKELENKGENIVPKVLALVRKKIKTVRDLTTQIVEFKRSTQFGIWDESLVRKSIQVSWVSYPLDEMYSKFFARMMTAWKDQPEPPLREQYIGRAKLVILDPTFHPQSDLNVIKQVERVFRGLQKTGLDEVWYGPLIYLQGSAREFQNLSPDEVEAYRKEGYNIKDLSAAGTYQVAKDEIVISTPALDVAGILAHELGHRYWYKVMTPSQQGRFHDFVQVQHSPESTEFPGGETDSEGRVKPVKPVSPYASTNISEAFAEVFRSYVLGWHLDRDQLESFKSIVQGVQMDRRAKNL